MSTSNHDMQQRLVVARTAFNARKWKEAFDILSALNQITTLLPADLEMLATAAFLTGHLADSILAWRRLHTAYLDDHQFERAVYCAFCLSFILFHTGEFARGNGWIARAKSLAQIHLHDSKEEGYLHLLTGLQEADRGKAGAAYVHFEQACQTGRRFSDRNLIALGNLGMGQVLIQVGSKEKGVSRLDEAMSSLELGEVNLLFEGAVYCAVIEACFTIHEISRARQWTEALAAWCDFRPQMVAFKGECLVRESQIYQMQGNWETAIEEARKAVGFLTQSKAYPATGASYYQLGELYRLTGNFKEAGKAYASARQWGRKIVPGMALLSLAMRKSLRAIDLIESVRASALSLFERYQYLPAYVEIMLATKNLTKARSAMEEMRNIANLEHQPRVTALADWWYGALLFRENRANHALEHLRKACSFFAEEGASYEVARLRFLLGQVYRRMGFNDTANIEFEAALLIFNRLGAQPDAARVSAEFQKEKKIYPHGLSAREGEVLKLVADGLSNKAIGKKLFISERTVERHISNLFAKIGVTSRSGLTAYAFKHRLFQNLT